MYNKHLFSAIEVALPFIAATLSILSSMAGINATAGLPYYKKLKRASGDISALVGVDGDKKGSIAVSFSKGCANALVKSMMGDGAEGILQNIQDAVGEVTNMISGQACTGLRAYGLTLQNAAPTVFVGDAHSIHHASDAPIIAIPFVSGVGDFTVEFCFE